MRYRFARCDWTMAEMMLDKRETRECRNRNRDTAGNLQLRLAGEFIYTKKVSYMPRPSDSCRAIGGTRRDRGTEYRRGGT